MAHSVDYLNSSLLSTYYVPSIMLGYGGTVLSLTCYRPKILDLMEGMDLQLLGVRHFSVSTSSPRVSGALALFMALSPELAQGLCWSRRSINDLGMFGSLQAQNRVRCPHPTRPLQEGFTSWFQGNAVSRTDLSEKRWQGTTPQVWLLDPFCELRPFGHLGKPVNSSHNNFLNIAFRHQWQFY